LLLLFLVPSGALLWTIPHSLARLKSNYEFSETVQPEAHDILPDDSAPATPWQFRDDERAVRAGLSVIEEIIQTRQFLATHGWSRHGWLEGGLWRWFSAREQALVEFAFPDGIDITRPWKNIFRTLAIGVAAGLVFAFAHPALKAWALIAGMVISFFQTLPCIYGTGHAFQQVFCSGVNIQMYAAYPVGYRELSRMLFKCSIIQLPMLAVLLTICAMITSHLTELSLAVGALAGFKISILAIAARFIFVMLGFSSGTNDSSRLRIRTIALVTSILCLGLLFLALAAAGVFVPVASAGLLPAGLVGWGFFALALVDAYALFRLYGWFYDANRFDIMSLPKQQA
jgi:hypothetical protein